MLQGLSGCSGCSDGEGKNKFVEPEPAGNQAPTANAGGDESYILEASELAKDVILDAGLSSDSDGSIATYAWTGSPDPEDVASPMVSLSPGTYTFTLVVTDNHGKSSSPDTVTITVETAVMPSEHHAPEIILDSDTYTVDEGTPLEIQISASDSDGDPIGLSASTRIPNVGFTAISGNPASGTLTYTPTYDQQGTHVVVFSAYDIYGNKSSKSIMIQVNNINRPPVLTLTDTATVDEGGLLTISIKASDPDDDILTYSADALPDNTIMVASAASITFMPDYDQAGTYNITCEVSDGDYSDSKSVAITVNDVPTGGAGEPHELILEVNEPESPSFLSSVPISGTVNPGADTPAPRSRQSALILAMSPATGKQGETLDVTLTGETAGEYTTHFASGISQAGFAKNVTVNSLTVNSSSEVVANITVSPDAAKGPRLATVTTNNETAISIVAFNVTAGSTTVTGTLLSDAGQPVANAVISVQGSLVQAQSLADGTFTLTDVPAGTQTLIINAPNHELTYLDISGNGGTDVALNDVEITATVFDPTAEPSATIHSLLKRGIGDITGNVTVQEAAQMIVDAIICVGGNEAGVLDAYGNQLNPSVEGLGKTSLTHKGVNNYAQRTAMGQSTTLMELFMDISFAFTWDPAPPTFQELLDGMQAMVNQAWNDPNTPSSRMPILLFNRGETLSPNPPTLNANTRISMFQAYLAVNSFMTTIYNHQDEWGNVVGYHWDKNPAYALFLKSGLQHMLSPSDAWAVDPPGVYTTTWESLISNFSVVPSGTSTSTGSPTEPTLPSFEELLKKYYLDLSEDALEKAKELLIDTFPTQFTEDNLNDIFEDDPYGLKAALEKLIHIGTQEQDIADLMGQLTSRDGKDTPGQTNLWHFWEVEKGKSHNLFFGDTLLPDYLPAGIGSMPYAHMIVSAMPLGTPRIAKSEDATTVLSSSAGDITIPAAKIIFYPSSDDKLDSNPSTVTFVYRLWRTDKGKKEVTDTSGNETTQKYDLTLAGYGKLGENKTLAPKIEKDANGNATGKYVFTVPLPPPGMNAYRIDCIRFNGDSTLIGDIDTDEFANRLTPWLAGYLDGPVTWKPGPGFTNESIHPATGVLKNLRYDISTLSKNASVYISGKAAGYSTFGRIDLTADYKNSEKVYISIPDYKTDAHGDRGTGSVFRYNGPTGELSEYTRPGFIEPGQIGLAIDKNSNLYTENAATETAYGGKLFRILGYRSALDPVYAPPYPIPDYENPTAAATGSPPHRLYVGSVNYYSSMIQRAHPVGLMGMIMGKASSRGLGEELYVADGMGSGTGGIVSGGMASQIKRVAVRAPETKNYPANHNVGELWAWNDLSDSSSGQADQDYLNFDPLTDLAFDATQSKLFITQGAYVIQTMGGKNTSFSITKDGTLFTSTSGCAVCESNGEEFLFVADRAENRILKIPLTDLNQPVTGYPDLGQLSVPADLQEKERLINRYTFYKDMDRPAQIRITDDGQAMVVSDNSGLRYLKFGFTSRALDSAGEPLIGAVVTIKTLAGEQSTTTDSEGNYHFMETDTYSVIADISHPDWSFSQRILVSGKCQYTTEQAPRPCVIITEPADGDFTNAGTTSVRGTIYPLDIDFTASGGVLEVITPDGANNYDLHFIGNGNDFEMSNVNLGIGTNYLIARTYASGVYEAGGSLASSITRTSSPITTQAISGVATDDEGNPLADVEVEIFVDSVLETTTETDACGYYNVQNLSLGTLSVNIIE